MTPIMRKAYGTEARAWLGSARRWDDLGEYYGAGLSRAEVDWMRREEWAMTCDDILWRRSKLGLVMASKDRERLAAYLEEHSE